MRLLGDQRFRQRASAMWLIVIFHLEMTSCRHFSVTTEGEEEGIRLFHSEQECYESCSGPHDLGCFHAHKGQATWICRCQADYYSSSVACYQGCHLSGMQILFIGQCVSTYGNFVGVCSLTCERNPSVLLNFLIALCAIAAIVVIILLPAIVTASITNHVLLRKQKKILQNYAYPVSTVKQNGKKENSKDANEAATQQIQST